MAISGSQKALMYAQGGIARGGATRGGYTSGLIFIVEDGVHIGNAPASGARKVILESLQITDSLDETPNRCAYKEHGSVPVPGSEIILTLGSKNNLERMFAGFLLDVNQIYAADNPKFVQADVSAVDYTWLFSFRKVTKRYRNLSASVIAADLVSLVSANGFTGRNIVAGLPVLDEITFTNEDLTDALTRLARRIDAYWYVDYNKDVHLFLSEVRNGAPVPLTTSHKSLAHFRHQTDRSQCLTRVFVEGRGSSILGAVLVGDTMIPLQAVDMFSVAADVFLKVSPQGSAGGAQHLNFSGVDVGGRGSLVGPGAGPPGPPTLAAAVGAGLSAGLYQYAYAFVTASGESLASSLAAIQVGALIPPPTTEPVAAYRVVPGNMTPGYHSWSYTFTTPSGETTQSPASPGISSQVPITPAGGIYAFNDFGGGPLPSSTWFSYKITYIGTGGGETTAAPSGATVFTGSLAPNHKIELFIQNAPAGAATFKVYRSPGGASSAVVNGPHYYVGAATVNVDGTGNFMDTTATLGAAIPTSGTALANAGVARVSMPIGPAGVTGRKLYRTNGGPWQLVAAIDNVAAYYDDGIADAALGSGPPSTNTAGDEYRRVQLSNIAAGPTAAPAVTSRKLYRTVVGGAQLKLLATLADNVTTTFLDSVADASLGANAPVGDTSGIVQPSGQVPAGSTSIIVANSGAFLAGGGWAVIGNGEQVVRYTGRSATALTGVPAAGVGSIIAAISYNSTITAAPMLTGIPSSGARSISAELTSGDELYFVVQVDDTARQATLAADMGVGDGIREEWIQDRRLSVVEARARGQSTLALHPLDERSVTYTCRDLRTASGKTIDVALGPPTNVSGSFKIQEVLISNFRPHANQYPTFTVKASARLFTFNDFLRRMETTE